MLVNDRLARAISDVGFGMFRLQIEYKAKHYGARLVIADRWYPGSRLCSICGWKNDVLTLKDHKRAKRLWCLAKSFRSMR